MENMENKLIFEKDNDKDWGTFYRVYSEHSMIKYVEDNKTINKKCDRTCEGFILSYPDENIYRFQPYYEDMPQQFGMDFLRQILDFLKELNKINIKKESE